MNALRMTGGFSQSLFETRTGLDFGQLQSFIEAGTSKQLLEIINSDDPLIQPTDLGMRYLDELLLLETSI
jgi:hypothetical protein